MLNLLRSEFYKMRKSVSLKICLLLSCISAAALIIISHNIAVGKMSADIAGSASGLTEIVIVSLLGSLMTGLLICGDFETKTIHDAITCGNGRSTVVITKMLMYILSMMLLLLPYAAAVLAGYLSGARFTSSFVMSVFFRVLTEVAGSGVTLEKVGKILAIFILTMLVYAARLCICVPLAFKLKKPVVILAIGFLFSALIDLVIGLISDVPVISKIISCTPFSRDFILMTMNTGAGMMIKAAASSMIFLGLITELTYLVFRRDDIK